MVSNICMVGLLQNYTKTVCKCIADALEMFYADVRELLEFDLISLAEASKIVGLDYIEKQEYKKIKTLASYENTIFTMDYLGLNQEENVVSVKEGSLLVYLKLSKRLFNQLIKRENLPQSEEVLLSSMFKEHNDMLSSVADVVVEIKTAKDDLVELVLGRIEEYYENR